MTAYLLKKILKNALLGFLACWVVYFILEQANGCTALAALNLTVNSAEIYMDGEPLNGQLAEVRKWLLSFKNVGNFEVDPAAIYYLPHKLEWDTALGRAYAGQFDTRAIFGYSIEIGDRYFAFEGSADCDNFLLWKEAGCGQVSY